MDAIEQFERTVDAATQMVRSVSASDLGAPTPCTEWTVQPLIEHMIGTNNLFSTALTGDAGQPPDNMAADLGASYARSAETAVAAWQTPGALERTLKLPMGEMPAAMALTINLGDQLLHTWDLARALSRPYAMDPESAEGVLTLLQQIVQPQFRGPGKGFAAEVPCPADAMVQDRLLAFSGRQP
jgi:uncharacterized protein (TIGR03086 family)